MVPFRPHRAWPQVLLALALSASLPAAADDSSAEDGPAATVDEPAVHAGLTWDPRYHQFRPWQYGTVGVLAVIVPLGGFLPMASSPRWQKPILFDAPLRDLLLADTFAAREDIADISDIVLLVTIAVPLVVDPLVVAWGLGGRPDVAWQMFAIGAQSMVLTGLVTIASKKLADRERPFVEPCESDADHSSSCGSDKQYESFWSGHSSNVFTAAGVNCAHHEALGLYGGGAWDDVACWTGIAAATAVGTFRVVSDRHWSTDVLAGAVVGLASGYLVPKALHYGFRRKGGEERAVVLVVPALGGGRVALSATGRF
ncbi:MAG: phosphatase PAP2 family protein [Deltaproteobacteria bacterium]|nr:phosphatase PAP2 family protein [Deltaproteobacteria bacterium]